MVLLARGRKQNPCHYPPVLFEEGREPEQKVLFGKRGRIFKTPHAFLVPSQCLLAVWAGEAALINTSVTIRCLNARKGPLEMRRK